MSHSRTRVTHTFVILDVSPDCYAEIAGKFEEVAGYEHVFHEVDGRQVVNMHGIAVRASSAEPSIKAARCPKCRASLVVCDRCFVAWCLDHQPNPAVCPGCGGRPPDGTRAQETP